MELRRQFSLKATRARPRRTDALSRHLPRTGLDGVLADLDRTATPCPVPGEAAGDGFTWEPRDAEDTGWFPQGVASVRGDDVLAVSWYGTRRQVVRTRGSRITVVDRTDPARPRYRHVLLVAGRRRPLLSLGAVRVHAGGIAVLGNLLYVADTLIGVRVFRLSDVLRVPRRRLDALLPWAAAGTRTLGRRLTGGFTAYGHEHVLPQLMSLRVPWRAGKDRLRYSFLSVGDVDGQLSLVVGEYRTAKGGAPRLVRYPLDAATGLPATGPDGRCEPVEVHVGGPPRMQGVAVDGDTWYISASFGADRRGDLYVGSPGALVKHAKVLPPGPEDLDWSVPGERLWGVTEHPGRRFVFPIEATRWRPGSR